MPSAIPAARRVRSNVFDRWHTRDLLGPDDVKCGCRSEKKKPSSRHGVGKRWTARYVPAFGGAPISKGFDTKARAEAWISEQMASVVRGDHVAPARAEMTVGALAEVWRAGLASRTASTRRSYESVLDTHVLPRWGKVRLADVEHGDIATWIASLTSERGLSPSSVRHVHVVTRMILDLAVRDGRMPRNLCDGVQLPRARRASQRFLSRAELARLVAAADYLASERERATREKWKTRTARRGGKNADELYEPTVIEQDDKGRNVIPPVELSVDGLMMRVLAMTGIRWGELAGLRVECVDLDKRRLRIERSVSEVGGKLEWSDTKNHTARSVAFPRSLVEPLREQIDGRKDGALVFSSRAWGKRSKVHAEGESAPIRNPSWSKRVFKPAVELAQLAPLTPHDLRDTYASLAIGKGASVKDVQRQLGHSSAAMTLDVYSGLFEDGLDAVADALDGE
ncbi:tyrosine-type recombinase/integrase [Rhodococcus sp. IEGM 1401]|uniref:tyrosine-type recombinase/integrase n=1 Tax=unclassified Rhodococcus (in: high G+C Gram-positive bacteria) TaxID=192944 RepID=UPI0022B54630|nr:MULTISPECIES: tyrosine-type recombinase/integrase [unclassified Rhodococcus (in: high G+C Gram-positive bacteria)]MCZ4559870.1 tyrosine-type recombinase/integrase [Rhodococcus sp. IEGM 1401]MDI9920086.1 tyrosine-type recombinase/integrase [Rhodococcus sp. IEGM 1372]MDV8032451.1 tyrosine-type recombinase/integrase [Rhodococcus sp. IEGM 1414]